MTANPVTLGPAIVVSLSLAVVFLSAPGWWPRVREFFERRGR